MMRKALMALALVAGLSATSIVTAGPLFGPQQPPSAAELGLNATQTAEWEAIQVDAKALRQTTLAEVESELGDAKQSLADPNADLRAVGAEFQAIAIGFLMEQRQLRDRRLAFYNGLNPSQQAQVREFLIGEIERAERAIRAFEVLRGE